MRAEAYGWLAFTQFLDSAIPVGGFSHSFGLETLTQEGRILDEHNLRDYIRTMLMRSWATTELTAIKAVYLYAEAGEWDRLWETDRRLHVQRAASETRTGQQKMGKRLLQLALSMYPHLEWEPLFGAQQRGECFAVHPIVYGWTARQLGVPLEMAAQGYAYGCIVQCVGSALRLMSIGQTQGQRIIADLLPLTIEAWRLATRLEPEDICADTPAADIAMMRHAFLYSRLFMS